jgi:hypothetical protein
LEAALWVRASTERVATAPASVTMRTSTVIVGSRRTREIRPGGDENKLYKSVVLQNMRETFHGRRVPGAQ